MKLNKDKHIGRVLFIVEESQTEFSVLKRIFCNLLGYSYTFCKWELLKQTKTYRYKNINVVRQKQKYQIEKR